MSVDLTITQKALFPKTLPLSVILGDKLRYGRYDAAWRLERGKLAEEEFIAYLPDAIGRGFSVTWNAREKRRVELRLLSPTGRAEIREFYAAVGRIMGYWHADLRVDGEKLRCDRWMAGMDDFISFNTRALRDICQKIKDGESRELTLFSALWPLTIGQEEALRFSADPAAFDTWLHEMQSIDAVYVGPRFYQTDAGIVGRYVLCEDCRSIFPLAPSVPFGLTDPGTGKQLVCDDHRVAIFSSAEEKILGELPFDRFLRRLPADKLARYDEHCVLIAPLSHSECKTILGDPLDPSDPDPSFSGGAR